MIRTAMAILTYVPEGCGASVSSRLRTMVSSVWETDSPYLIVVVDDHSTDLSHREYLDFLEKTKGTRVVRRGCHGGIARAKNTCLRLLSECKFDVAFIAEDDLCFSPGWKTEYCDAHVKTGIEHFSWSWDDDPGNMWRSVRRINGFNVCETSRVNGSLLSLTPKVIEKVGGFKVMPAPWGHEHTNWTKRIRAVGLTPFFSDIVGSNDYVWPNCFSQYSAISEKEKREFASINEKFANDIEPVYLPLEE